VIRVVIADDQGMVRAGLRSLLEQHDDIRVVGDAADGEHAITAVRRHRPHVALMDIRMPHLDGLAATRALVGEGLPTRILILTTFDLDEYVFEALRAGASGFLLKDAPVEEIVAAIRVLAAGDALMAPAVTRRVIEAFTSLPAPPSEPPKGARRAHRARARGAGALTRGLSNAEIAAELVVGEATVKTHVGRILMKLGLRDRVQAVVLAYESGLVQPGHTETARRH
jgi:DNA-binding NarL/FixJ family response regulator